MLHPTYKKLVREALRNPGDYQAVKAAWTSDPRTQAIVARIRGCKIGGVDRWHRGGPSSLSYVEGRQLVKGGKVLGLL
jgi:hypothetical protein